MTQKQTLISLIREREEDFLETAFKASFYKKKKKKNPLSNYYFYFYFFFLKGFNKAIKEIDVFINGTE